MATREKFRQSVAERRRRIFSEEFKRKKVREIEQKTSTVAEVAQQYECTEWTVRRWLIAYSNEKSYMKGARVIVESESDTRRLADLKAKIAELERLVGQKQIEVEFSNKMIDLAEEIYGVDIKKKFGSKLSSGSGTTGSK